MEGFTQLSLGMCPIRTPLQGKHPPLLCQTVQFSAAFNHKKGRGDLSKEVEKKRKSRGAVKHSPACPVSFKTPTMPMLIWRPCLFHRPCTTSLECDIEMTDSTKRFTPGVKGKTTAGQRCYGLCMDLQRLNCILTNLNGLRRGSGVFKVAKIPD